jgi:hypothetical protein
MRLPPSAGCWGRVGNLASGDSQVSGGIVVG